MPTVPYVFGPPSGTSIPLPSTGSTIASATAKNPSKPTSGVSSNKTVKEVGHVQQIQHYIHLHLDKFPHLKLVHNIENILLAQAKYESSYNPRAFSGVNSHAEGTAGGSYVRDPVYGTGVNQGFGKARLQQGLQGWGLGQVLGMYLFRGTQVGKEFIQHSRYRSISESLGLIVPIGTDLTTIFTHDAIGIQRGVVSQMITLDNKYRIYRESQYNTRKGTTEGNWIAFVKGLRAYLGDSTKADINGIFPKGYADTILKNANSPSMSYAGNNSGSNAGSTENTRVASTNSTAVARPASGCP